MYRGNVAGAKKTKAVLNIRQGARFNKKIGIKYDLSEEIRNFKAPKYITNGLEIIWDLSAVAQGISGLETEAD